MLELPVDELSEELSIPFTTKGLQTEFVVPIDWEEIPAQH